MEQAHKRGATVRVDAAGCIDEDLACEKCAYSLRGMRTDGTCPECGLAIAESIRRDRLLFCHPEWLRSLLRGTVCLLIAWVCLIASPITAALTSSNAVLTLCLSGTAIVATIGMWLLTQPPPDPEYDFHRTRRQIARLSGVTLPILLVLRAAHALSDGIDFIPLDVGLALHCAVALPSLLVYLRTLAIRIPAPQLAERSQNTATLVAIYFIAWTGVLIMDESPTISFLRGVLGIGLFVAPWLFVWVIEKYRYRLRLVLTGAKARLLALI